MMKPKTGLIHAILIGFVCITLLPFAFMLNNVCRSNFEFYRDFFSIPDAFKGVAQVTWRYASGNDEELRVADERGEARLVDRGTALRMHKDAALNGPKAAWEAIRPYMLNSLIVSLVTALGVCCIGSSAAYILARYKFMGHKVVFVLFLATMMFPGVLTLVPSFLLVKEMGLLNTYWAMILPYMAGGQVFAIFVFRSFFMGLPEDFFEIARIDGAGHFSIYWHLVLPLSKPVFSVVIVMNIMGTWNNFLWPFIVNTDGSHQVVSSGIYTLATSPFAANFSTMYAAYAISSLPLLVLFVYATKPFIRGVTTGGLKA